MSERLARGDIPADHPVWDVWSVVRGAFPSATTNWADTPEVAWAAAIEGLSLAQLQRGCERLVTEPREFPPNAGQFRSLCTGGGTDWEHRRREQADQQHRIDETAPRIAVDPGHAERVRAAGVAAMRAAMGIQPETQETDLKSDD